MPIPTPFHSRTAPLCESHEWRNWSGYLAVGTYEPSHEREYYAIRNSAALIDISPLYKYDISGPDALQLVNKTITRDMSKTEVGQIIYSPWCDEHGKIIDDGTIWQLDEQHFRVTAADPNLRWLQDCGFGLDATVSDQTQNLAALAIQGPLSRNIVSNIVEGIDINEISYYWLAEGKVGGSDIAVTRTGYTGDLGYELWVAPPDAELLWDALIEAGTPYGLLPAGMVALDIARIEAGLLLIEVDYISSHKAITEARKSSPYETGLGWTVALEKGPFVGRPALAREKESEQKWSLVGLEIDWPMLERKFAEQDLPPMVAGRASRSAVPLYNKNERQVGYVTSRTFSPILKKYIALATVESAYSKKETELQVEITVEFSRQKVRATVVKMPFYEPAWKKG
jgi:aminomethyltransferase